MCVERSRRGGNKFCYFERVHALGSKRVALPFCPLNLSSRNDGTRNQRFRCSNASSNLIFV